ncbi:MAG: hypothetical protein AAFQ43_13500 [Bacteroidota bacterium]
MQTPVRQVARPLVAAALSPEAPSGPTVNADVDYMAEGASGAERVRIPPLPLQAGLSRRSSSRSLLSQR